MAELFGFTINRVKKDTGGEQVFTTPTPDDGAIDIAGGGFFGQILDTDGREKTELDLIRRYRDIAQQPECDSAVEDIINEAISYDEVSLPVSLRTDRMPYPEKIKRAIRKEFEEVLSLLDFEEKGQDIMRRWYVDGRIFYHKVIDSKNPKRGIVDLRYIDPTKIKKARQVKKDKDTKTGVDMIKKIDEYYIYNEKGLFSAGYGGANQGLKIAADAIAYCPSGIIDQNGGKVLSYLHKAIKPVNQLRMIEDALVIYRISRAPERRIFYIDVGNLPKIKAEQYLKDVMNRYRNKLVYDASTGEIRDDRNHMSMLEDFWLPRREGGRGTEIDTLSGGANLGEIEDIEYFRQKLYRSLNVPISRLEAENNFSLGRTTEITRDELKFTKFIQKIRKKFTHLFSDILKTQLVLKGIISLEDWDVMKEHIQYDFLKDGHFAELKEAELLRDRIEALDSIQSYIGTFFSKEYVLRNILRMNDSQIDDMRDQIAREMDMDPMDGGISIPKGGDGVTRYPSDGSGAPIGADDYDTFHGAEDPEDDLKKAQAAQAKADAGLKDADAAAKKNGNGDK